MIVDRVYIDEQLTGNFAVDNFLKNYNREFKIEYFNDFNFLIKKLNLKFNYETGKNAIVFKRNKGRFLKKCPCSSGVQSCGYYVLNIIKNCYIGCSYCYLQQYTNNNIILINPNIDGIYNELSELTADAKNDKTFRLGSGEFSDSLLFDEYTGITLRLLEITGKFDKVFFEIKTKTSEIAHILKKFSGNSERVIFAWSVNPQNIIESEEPFAASLEARLAAAKSAADKGYSLAFHFDPVILYDDWEQEYKSAIQKIFDAVAADRIVWISVGSFRCAPELISIIKKTRPESRTYPEEMIIGTDGKIRYPFFIRKKIYKILIDEIKKYNKKTVIYLCMENLDMWEETGAAAPVDIVNFKRRN